MNEFAIFLLLMVLVLGYQIAKRIDEKLDLIQFWIDLLASERGICADTKEEIVERGPGNRR